MHACWLKSAPASPADRGPQLARWLREWPDGRIKLAMTTTLLQHRAEFAELYRVGDYQPLTASGPRSEQLGAYLRHHAGQTALIAFARHPRQFGPGSFDDETFLPLPETLAGQVMARDPERQRRRGVGSVDAGHAVRASAGCGAGGGLTARLTGSERQLLGGVELQRRESCVQRTVTQQLARGCRSPPAALPRAPRCGRP